MQHALSPQLAKPCAFKAAKMRTRTLLPRIVTARAAKQDELIRTMSDSAEVAVMVLDATKLVADAQRRHKTAPTSTAALGRALMGALLMASFGKEDESVQVTFKGDGPIDNVMVIANSKGDVKGRVGNPTADPPLRDDGKLNVGAAVGKGVLAVVRSNSDPYAPPYTGMVPIISGEVAEDLANYLVDSEQTNSALGLGVALDRDCNVKAAGGWMVQILPFCSEETLSQLETTLTTMPSVTQMLSSGMSPQDIADRILEGMGRAPDLTIIEPKYGPCDADELRGRMLKAVSSLGKDEVQKILEEDQKIEVTCEFCQEQYQFYEKDLQDVLTVV